MTLKRLTVLVWLVGVLVVALPAAAQAAESITIGSTDNPATYTDSGGTITPTADDAQVGVSVIDGDLQSGNVSINTGTTGTQPGNITVASDIAPSSGNFNLTFTPASGGAVQLNTAHVDYGGYVFFDGPVSLLADTSVSQSAAVTFASTLDSATSGQPRSLTVSGSAVEFDGAIGATTPLASLNTSGVPTFVYGNVITTTGAQTYGPTTLYADTTLNAGSGDVSFTSTVDGYSALTVSQAGSLSFGGPVGGTREMTDLTIGPGIATSLSGDVTVSGNQTYGGPLTFGTSATLSGGGNSSGDPQVSFQGVNGTASDTLTLRLTGQYSTATLNGTTSVSINANVGKLTVLGTDNGPINGTRNTVLGCNDFASGGSTVGTINGQVTGGGGSPDSVPAQPSGTPTASAGNGAATVSGFTPGAVTCHPTTYIATSNSSGGHSSTGTEADPSPLTVTGLTNSRPYPYQFNVVAVNPLGLSRASANSNAVTPQQPTATISPSNGGSYTVGQFVPTQFSCTYASTCVDSNANATGSGQLYTGTAGTYTYTVTATPSSGPAVSTQITYTVTAPPPTPSPTPSPTAGAPTATISSPHNNQIYTAGALVHPSFHCAEGHGGPGLVSCLGNGVSGHLNTSHAGHYTYTVTAVSADGQRGHASVNYTVVAPSNRFSLHSVKRARAGVVSFSLKLPDAGTISVTETAVIAGHTKVYARVKINGKGGNVKLRIGPGRAGRRLLRAHPHLVIGLSVSFTPKYGNTRTLKSIRVRLQS
jgi:hypothetical protein